MMYELNDPSKAAPLFADWKDGDASAAACLDNASAVHHKERKA